MIEKHLFKKEFMRITALCNATRAGPPKPLEFTSHKVILLRAGPRSMEFTVFLVVFQSCFGSIPFYAPIFLLWNAYTAPLDFDMFNCVFSFTETCSYFNFSVILKLLRLWQLLKIN